MAQVLFPDTYADETDFEIQPLQEKFDELVQETFSDITGNSAYHNEQNPGGPKHDDYEKVFDQYAPFNNIYVNYDEYDTNSWYWDASFSIDVADPHFKDLQIPEDVDASDFADAIHKGIDGAGIYPDEVEPDDYEGSARVRLTPDHDEQTGLDGFESFLSRMRDVDDIIESEDFWESLATNLMDAGLTSGGLKELEDKLDEIDFKNLEYGIEGRELNIFLKFQPTIARPKGISGTYFGRMINSLAGERTKTWPSDARVPDTEIGTAPSVPPAAAENISKAISDNTVNKIARAIKDRYEDYYQQLELPGLELEPGAEPAEALPLIDMEFFPLAGEIQILTPDGEKIKFSTKQADTGAGGMNIVFPYNFVLSLTNQQYWESIGADEEEVQALISFLKWIDEDDVRDQIQALLQASLNDAALAYMKEYPQQSAQDLEKRGAATHFADVEDEPQVAENRKFNKEEIIKNLGLDKIQEVRYNLWQVSCIVVVDGSQTREETNNRIRGIEGVTVVDAHGDLGDVSRIGSVKMKIKFLQGRYSIDYYLKSLRRGMLRVPGVTKVSPLRDLTIIKKD